MNNCFPHPRQDLNWNLRPTSCAAVAFQVLIKVSANRRCRVFPPRGFDGVLGVIAIMANRPISPQPDKPQKQHEAANFPAAPRPSRSRSRSCRRSQSTTTQEWIAALNNRSFTNTLVHVQRGKVISDAMMAAVVERLQTTLTQFPNQFPEDTRMKAFEKTTMYRICIAGTIYAHVDALVNGD